MKQPLENIKNPVLRKISLKFFVEFLAGKAIV